ncbi:WD40 repeat domain-containing protein [Deinococcus knuensis]|uniref:WD40 repeat domain-containing protein n=1 Tax=Deinococcus knuensis TaxID=1837380 RepID=A0ABQ2SXC2_9DEIO|nr:hypothetical protein [Deinococcus knuensis]GGS41050.1 hypothetical protein GCM10008961_35500 [Deinococcus knuensis]
MNAPIRAAAVLSVLLSPLAAPAAGLSLASPQGVFLTGPVNVSGARLLPGGGVVVCLGARLSVLDGAGAALRSVPTGADCAGLSVSPDGTLALTTTQAGGNEEGSAGVVSVWRLADGVRTAQLSVPQLAGAGFNGPRSVLIGSARGTEQLDLPSGTRRPLGTQGVTFLTTSADGTHAVVGRDRRVQLLDARTAAVLSGHVCDDTCPVGTVGFSADGRSAAVQAGTQLIALRENYPSTVVARDAGQVAGIPLRDGTVLTLEGAPGSGELQRRDLLTGRREKTLTVPGGPVQPTQVAADGQLLSVTAGGLSVGTADQPAARRISLPARVTGGGTDPATGRAASLLGGALSVNGQVIAPQVWAVQTMNRATWLLAADGSGGLSLRQLDGGKVRTVAPAGTATQLSVNHWGNVAAVWNDDRLSVVSQKTGKVTATLAAPGLLGAARVTLSPDATRAFVLPARGDGFVALLDSGKRFALPVAPGRRAADVQISGRGVLAFTAPDGTTDLYQPGNRVPYATVSAAPPARTVSSARFSPDSALLAVPARDERGWRVDLVNAATGRVDARTPVLADPPSFIAWAADSRSLTLGAGRLDRLESVTVFPLAD